MCIKKRGVEESFSGRERKERGRREGKKSSTESGEMWKKNERVFNRGLKRGERYAIIVI